MTISPIRPRSGELPPGVVDGYCTTCAGETIVSAPDYACPACNTPVHLDSLPREARLEMMRGRTGPQASESADQPQDVAVEAARTFAAQKSTPAASQPVKTKLLPATKAARRWDAATDELVAEAEAEEAAKKAAYDTAKREYETAAQAANYARQLRQLARVDGAASAPVAVKGPRSAPALDGRWSRQHDACINCGTTSIKHASHGRCQTCEKYKRANGVERPTTREAQTNG